METNEQKKPTKAEDVNSPLDVDNQRDLPDNGEESVADNAEDKKDDEPKKDASLEQNELAEEVGFSENVAAESDNENEISEDKPEPVKEKKAEVVEESDSNSVEDVSADSLEGSDKESELVSSKQLTTDYSGYNKVQLINAFRKLIAGESSEDIKHEVDVIKSCFYKIHNADLVKLKQEFIAGGGNEQEFNPDEDPYEKDLKDLLKEYKNLRAEHNKRKEAEKGNNYNKKLDVIDEIKALINGEESINATFHEFHELQNRWKSIGQVPQGKVKDLWEKYHHHVELFYDYIKINRELRDLDLKRNMDLKTGLCVKAEELAADETNPMKTFRELQKLHENWREVGPVPRDKKQELWDRFKEATTIINKRHQQFFEDERNKQKDNLKNKLELCEKAEGFSDFDSSNPRKWNEMTDKIIVLQEEWKTIGYAPRKENAEVWERFRTANDAFFRKKREFWTKSKEQLHKNLLLKIEICEKAEALKESQEWKTTTDKLISLQKKWKEVGPVARKQSDVVWKRFRAACDEFFTKKTNHFSGLSGEQEDNLKAKNDLLEEVLKFQPSDNTKDDIACLNEFYSRWDKIGHVPFRKKDDVQTKFREAVNLLYDKLDMDEQERNICKFRNKVNHWMSIPKGWSKINSERERCVNRMKQIESDLVTLKNNIGFFGTSKGAVALIEGVNIKIEQSNSQIKYLKSKIRIIDDLED
jgi:hypothetical protein